MTAEIAVLNKEAIALAADSAVTMSIGETGGKVFTSANKLFALSKYEPIGIMVYGNANLMGVPWETIIKVYRNKLGRQKFNTLGEYVNSFIKFLDGGNPLFPDSVQEENLRISIYSYFKFILSEIRERMCSLINEKGKATDKEVKRIVSQVIKDHYIRWSETGNVPTIPKSYNRNIAIKHKRIIDKAVKDIFEELPISKNGLKHLTTIAASLFSKFPEDLEIPDLSGVVIAGFGEDDTFPSLKSFDIEVIVENRLKYKERSSTEINFDMTASVMAFAQKEMVATFMEGIDPYMHAQLDNDLIKIFVEYPGIIVDSIDELDGNKKRSLKERLKKLSKGMLEDYQKELAAYIRKNYIEPVVNVVTMLPKDELATMAETLVNLTSFKRKVTKGKETVGGPIDVAVISKGDGFVWVKRKHYFQPELNPHYLAKLYKEV